MIRNPRWANKRFSRRQLHLDRAERSRQRAVCDQIACEMERQTGIRVKVGMLKQPSPADIARMAKYAYVQGDTVFVFNPEVLGLEASDDWPVFVEPTPSPK